MHLFLDGSGRLSGKQCSHQVRNRAAPSQSGTIIVESSNEMATETEKSKLTSIILGLLLLLR